MWPKSLQTLERFGFGVRLWKSRPIAVIAEVGLKETDNNFPMVHQDEAWHSSGSNYLCSDFGAFSISSLKCLGGRSVMFKEVLMCYPIMLKEVRNIGFEC